MYSFVIQRKPGFGHLSPCRSLSFSSAKEAHMTTKNAASTDIKPLGMLGKIVVSIVGSSFLFLFIVLSGFRVHFSTISGEKVGQIFGINKEGFISLTWEAELVRGGMNDGSGAFGVKPFNFTVPSDELAEKVRKYAESKTEVLIYYHSARVYWYQQSENEELFLDDIKPVKK